MIFISERYAEWVGRPVKYFYENPNAWPDTIYQGDRDRAVMTYINACKNKSGYYQEYRVVKKDNGQIRWVRDHAIPILDEQGDIIRFDGTITDITEQYELRESLQYYTSALTSTQEEERRRIALELHDGSIQALFNLTTEISELVKGNKRLVEKDLRKMKKIQTGINSVMNDLRGFCHELRPSVLDHLGLMPSLELLVEEMNRAGEIKCDVEVVGQRKRLSSDIELALFRITQEALSNIKKHSRAKEALVRVKYNDSDIELQCIDNGCGFKMPSSLGGFARESKLGVLGMVERARVIGGDLSISSHNNAGTTITVVAPV
jgi:two-component system sensor histidine kinase DegS